MTIDFFIIISDKQHTKRNGKICDAFIESLQSKTNLNSGLGKKKKKKVQNHLA